MYTWRARESKQVKGRIKMLQDLRSTRYVKAGDLIECLYPKHGRMNILTKRVGKVAAVGCGPEGRYITVEVADGVFRTLSESKIIKLRRHK